MSESWSEWGVRRTWGLAVGSVANFERDGRTAAKCAREWPGALVHRVVTATDWSDEITTPTTEAKEAER